MPARPAYFHRLADAIATLRALETDWVDRRTLEETLGVSKTVAWRILRRCGGHDGPGNALFCRREELVRALEALQQTGEYEREIRRRGRLEQNLEQLLKFARARQIRVGGETRSHELISTRFDKLPPGVELSRSRLAIEFSGTADFLEKVGALIFALQNDYEAVCEFLDRDPA